MTPEPQDEVMTREQVAALLKVKPITVQRWHHRGLPYSKLGTSTRYRRSAVLAWVAEHERRQEGKRNG